MSLKEKRVDWLAEGEIDSDWDGDPATKDIVLVELCGQGALLLGDAERQRRNIGIFT